MTLVEFFTESSHEDLNGYNLRENPMSVEKFDTELRLGSSLKKPEYAKFAITKLKNGGFCLGFDTHSFAVDKTAFPVIQALMKEQPINLSTYPNMLKQLDIHKLVMELYNHHALEFTS